MAIFSFSRASDHYGQMVEYWFRQPAWVGILRRNELGCPGSMDSEVLQNLG
jgi:hypothetical protein